MFCKILETDDGNAIIFDEDEFDPALEAWREHLLDVYWDYFYYAPRAAAALDEALDETDPLN
jgi:hypothetical protein